MSAGLFSGKHSRRTGSYRGITSKEKTPPERTEAILTWFSLSRYNSHLHLRTAHRRRLCLSCLPLKNFQYTVLTISAGCAILPTVPAGALLHHIQAKRLLYGFLRSVYGLTRSETCDIINTPENRSYPIPPAEFPDPCRGFFCFQSPSKGTVTAPGVPYTGSLTPHRDYTVKIFFWHFVTF